MFWDYTYILVLIGALISLIASANVKGTYSRYSRVLSMRGIRAEEVAEQMLRNVGIYDVSVQHISGSLTDHYSPNEKVLRLSDSVYGSSSVAAIGVAAHECGHALQHQEGYAPLKLRSIAVPMANYGSFLSWPVIILGVILGSFNLTQLGIILFSFVVIFQLITLPVEFNASKRALKTLENSNILIGEEMTGAKAVLSAAALTYVAALISSILQLLRLIMLFGGNNRRSR